MNAVRELPPPVSRRVGRAGLLLGFALGGFFDGILLHQVLQWHHLLSAVESAAVQDLRVQILADGLFHALMYLVAAAGLWQLWRARHDCVLAGAGRVLAACALLGFGAWHILDGILSHWLLGIHRIRMEADNPLFWDLLWFVVFGVLFVAAGWVLLRGKGRSDGWKRAGNAAALLLTVAVAGGGAFAAMPAPDSSTVLAFYGPGTRATTVFRGIDAAGARVLWAAGGGSIWALDVPDRARTDALYRHGAWLVSDSLLAGCLGWFARAPSPPPAASASNAVRAGTP